MDTKLTLKLNKDIIEEAKKYASQKKISLSKIVESYLQSLMSDNKGHDLEISPFVKSMSTGTKIPTDIDIKEKYTEQLLKKYK
ncbi:DUF6364 family protein [Salibacter sp.]|uniref:DUF6364 family protein n=1 Tax=Salibacter sp. TaxID=2010995 RepID=UPI00286FEAE2|nr:DUF6364 family protein [Salibacter sp.]MDR9399659.1 DUF6364 family protein [Salibacter sp.]MDR9488430.1 DUF6364 family protein [Salibacter sp.]